MWYMGIQWITTQLLKKKKRMPFAATWMDLEMIILGKVSQTENLYVGYKIWHRASLVVWW